MENTYWLKQMWNALKDKKIVEGEFTFRYSEHEVIPNISDLIARDSPLLKYAEIPLIRGKNRIAQISSFLDEEMTQRADCLDSKWDKERKEGAIICMGREIKLITGLGYRSLNFILFEIDIKSELFCLDDYIGEDFCLPRPITEWIKDREKSLYSQKNKIANVQIKKRAEDAYWQNPQDYIKERADFITEVFARFGQRNI